MAQASAHAIDPLLCRIRDESPAMVPPTGACNGAARALGKLSVCALRATDSRALRVPEVAPHTPEARVAKPDECWQTRPLYGGQGAKTTGAWLGVIAKIALLGRREKDSVSERCRDSTRDCDQRIATKV